MTPDIKKHKVRRNLSIFCSSSNFLSLQEELIWVTPLLLGALKERFYEAGIRISEPEPTKQTSARKRTRRARSPAG
jgi:hypothetical protein